jgi:hypothetical protein
MLAGPPGPRSRTAPVFGVADHRSSDTTGRITRISSTIVHHRRQLSAPRGDGIKPPVAPADETYSATRDTSDVYESSISTEGHHMNPLRTAAVGVVSAFALSTFALTGASAATADHKPAKPSEPCAAQQAQVDKATAKLALLTEKYAAHHTKKVKKAKKAQVQRVAHATARLNACLTARPLS